MVLSAINDLTLHLLARHNIPSERNPSSENNGGRDIDFFFVYKKKLKTSIRFHFQKRLNRRSSFFFKWWSRQRDERRGTKRKTDRKMKERKMMAYSFTSGFCHGLLAFDCGDDDVGQHKPSVPSSWIQNNNFSMVDGWWRTSVNLRNSRNSSAGNQAGGSSASGWHPNILWRGKKKSPNNFVQCHQALSYF